MKKYNFHSDAGHGWLAVKRAELVELGILDKVSNCSYVKGDTVYLEEDCDAVLFIVAYRKKNNSLPEFSEKYQDRSPIRSYDRFVPTALVNA